MKRLMGNMKRRGIEEKTIRTNSEALPQGDAPEAVIVREVTAFCESGGPDSNNAGDEYLHLPAIVDAAESSPAAAKAAAATIRKYLSKDNYTRGYAQYNAIMLTRILTDNPAKAFTQNFDSKFVMTVKELLRDGKDMSVQQILRETLDYIEMEKHKGNDTLTPIVEMWKKEKSKKYGGVGYAGGGVVGPRNMRAPPFNPNQQNPNFYAQQRRQRGLPPPAELASRIEEAKTTARLLLQTIQSTPSVELPANELVREFAERAKSAQRSIQGYMNSENPVPDEDTMLTLIETSDQLNIAMSKHQRALLQARKAVGPPSPQTVGGNGYPPQNQNPYFQPPPPQQQTAFGTQQQYPPQPPPRDSYLPPSGPPPAALGAIRSNDYAYGNPQSQSPPPVPARSHGRTQSAEYSTSPENPFADQNSSSTTPQQTQEPTPMGPVSPVSDSRGGSRDGVGASGQNMPGPYNTGYNPTPSYIYRQESSAEHFTMHGGANPQPSRGLEMEGDGGDFNGTGTETGVERKLGDMRL